MAMGVYHFFQTHPDFVVCFVYVFMIVLLIYARQAGKSVAFSGAGSLKQWSLQYDFILLSDWWGSLDTADPSMDPLVGLADGHHFFGGKCHWHKFWTRRFIPWNGHEATVPVDIFPWHCIELFTFILAQHWRAFFLKRIFETPKTTMMKEKSLQRDVENLYGVSENEVYHGIPPLYIGENDD